MPGGGAVARTTPPPLRGARTTIPPVFQPPPPPEAIVNGSLIDTDFQIEQQLGEDDAPFRAPSGWTTPPRGAQADTRWHWSERSTAAFLGFAAGVLIIVPAVFLLANSQGQTPRDVVDPSVVTIANDGTTVAEASHAEPLQASTGGGKWLDIGAASRRSDRGAEAVMPASVSVTETATAGAADASRGAVQEAQQALEAGNAEKARGILRAAASADAPKLWFLLAETYDPLHAGNNAGQKGAGGVAGANAAGLAETDVKFADYYYRQALTHGVEAARGRIEALREGTAKRGVK